MIKINDNASVFTAELYAIVTALYWISQNWYAKNLIISDSLSSLKAISCHENDCRHFSNQKSNLHYTRRITPKRVTSCGAHLRGLAPGQHSSEETSQRWRVVGDFNTSNPELLVVVTRSRRYFFSLKKKKTASQYANQIITE